MSVKKTLVCGGGVLDVIVKNLRGRLQPGKQVAEFAESPGGSVFNVALQGRQLVGHVLPTVFVGKDPPGQFLAERAEELFSDAMAWPILEFTRRSVIIGDSTITCRPRVIAPEIPPGIAERIAGADRLVAGPDHPQNAAFLGTLLDLNPNSVLQLSKLQTAHPATIELARKAACLGINDEELAAWSSGPKLPRRERMLALRQQGVRDLIVTHARGVEALFGDRFFTEPAFRVRRVLRTSSAGDKFLATFLAFVDEEGPEIALRLGQAAAALFVEGASGYDSSAVIRRVCEERPRVDLVPKTNGLRRAVQFFVGLFA